MASPTYATDLVTIVDFDGTPSSPSVLEPTATWTAGRSPTTDTDFPIQGTNHASLTMNTTGKAGILCTNGSTGTWTSGNYLFGWIVWLAPGAITTEASGGLVMLTGSGTGDYKVFYIGGNSSGKYPYGGWQNFAVDPTMTADETVGTPTAYNVIGAGANVATAVAKGNPLGFDVFRYGRGTLRVGAGDGTTPATFSGMAAANDASSARWGLFEANPGVYKYKGELLFGYGSACTFVDANKNIIIDYTKYCQSNFNQINIQNASSNISWDNISIASLSTVSPGSFTVVDNATVSLGSCTFTDMGAFTFLSNTTIDSTTFRRCGQITANSAVITNSLVTGYTGASNTSALVWNTAVDPNGKLDGTTFVKGTGTVHAIEFGTSSPTTMTLTDVSFSGYNATNNQNDSAIHIKRTSGTVTINIEGGDVPSYRSDGATVVIQATVTHTLTGIEANSQVSYIRVSDGVEVFHVETVSTPDGNGKYKTEYSYEYAADVTVDIHIDNIAGFQWYGIFGVVLTNQSASIPVSQIPDRVYSNPT